MAETSPVPLPPHWFQILLSIADGPRHGLSITEDVLARTDGRLKLWPGVLYTALKKMADAGLVIETDAPAGFSAGGGKPRFFRATARGRRVCADEATYLSRVVAAARAKRLLRPRRAGDR